MTDPLYDSRNPNHGRTGGLRDPEARSSAGSESAGFTDVEAAQAIASIANDCCYRSDGWEEHIAEEGLKIIRSIRRIPDAAQPSVEAMKAAVELEIHAALGRVQTVEIGRMIQKAIDASQPSPAATVEDDRTLTQVVADIRALGIKMTDPHNGSSAGSVLDAHAYATDWKRQIVNAGVDENRAQQAVTLAALNGLFDHLRTEPQGALIRALQDIAGDDEPRPMLDGTTAENLRNIARRALAVTRPHLGRGE